MNDQLDLAKLDVSGVMQSLERNLQFAAAGRADDKSTRLPESRSGVGALAVHTSPFQTLHGPLSKQTRPRSHMPLIYSATWRTPRCLSHMSNSSLKTKRMQSDLSRSEARASSNLLQPQLLVTALLMAPHVPQPAAAQDPSFWPKHKLLYTPTRQLPLSALGIVPALGI